MSGSPKVRRIRAAWRVLRGEPTIYGVNSLEIMFSEAALAENWGIKLIDCDRNMIRLPPGTFYDVDGVIGQVPADGSEAPDG